MKKMIQKVKEGYTDSLLKGIRDLVDIDKVEKLETYKEIETSLRQQLEKNREESTRYWIEAKIENVKISVTTLNIQNKEDVYERIIDTLKQELDREYDRFFAGLDKDFESLDLYAEMLYEKNVATIFTIEEIDSIVNVIDQIVTQTADELPSNLAEWIERIVKLGKNSIDINTIKKIVSRTTRSDISVEGCLYTYLGNLDTQISSIEKRIGNVERSF